MALCWLLVAVVALNGALAEERTSAREGKQFLYNPPMSYLKSPYQSYYPQYGYMQTPNPYSPYRTPMQGYNTDFIHPMSYNPYIHPQRWIKPSISISKPQIHIKKPKVTKPSISITKPQIHIDKEEKDKPKIKKPQIKKPNIKKPEIKKPNIKKPEYNKDKKDKPKIEIKKKKDHYTQNRNEAGDGPTAEQIAAALEAAGIQVPADSVIVITGKNPDPPPICPEGVECVSAFDNNKLCPDGYEFDEVLQECKPIQGKQPSASNVPGQVPLEMAQAVGVSSVPQSIFESGTIVGLLGKEPSAEHLCGEFEGQETCVTQSQACGQTVNGDAVCISPTTLTNQNPLATQGNEAFQVGLDQLTLQLTGRDPSEAIPDDSRLSGADRSYYYWVYRIYYHVDSQASGVWMGHIQLYLGYYQWTIGLYYWIDPWGDLILVYYSVTPSDGYVAEVAVWRNFVPYTWQRNQRVTNFKSIIPQLDVRSQ